MRTKCIVATVLMGLVFVPAVRAQSFDGLWKQVDEAVVDDLPQTVIELTGRIFEKGRQEKNTPQMLRAYMWRMKYKQDLVPDSFYTQLKGLERWVMTADKPADRAVLYSVIAGMYADYVRHYGWRFREQKQVAGQAMQPVVPADTRMWTADGLNDTVKACVRNALADAAVLFRTSSKDYIPYVIPRKAGDFYHHNLYHLLALRSISQLDKVRSVLTVDVPGDAATDSLIQMVRSVYEQLLSAYEADRNDEAYVLTMLNYLEWRNTNDPGFRPLRTIGGRSGPTENPYMTGLDQLLERFGTNPICAEVYLAKAQCYRNKDEVGVQLCDEAIARYPSYQRINALKNWKEGLLHPSLSATAARRVYPGEEVSLNVIHQNLDGLTLYLFDLDKKLVEEKFYPLVRSVSFKDTVLTFQAPKAGRYVMKMASDSAATSVQERGEDLHVTAFKVLENALPDGRHEVIVLDERTGFPCPGVTVSLYDEKKQVQQTFATDNEGRTDFPWEGRYSSLQVSCGADSSEVQRIRRGTYVYDSGGGEFVMLLTDRSVYHPGQTVRVKGLAYLHGLDTAYVLANRQYTVELSDTNRDKVSEQSARTNAFGSFITDFTLPADCPEGPYQLTVNGSRVEIQVKKYERPAFDISFNPGKDSYRVGDRAEVAGKVQAFSGMALQGLSVKYTLVRTTFEYNRDFSGYPQAIASGEVKTDDKGQFVIPVELLENPIARRDRHYYRYSIETTVTNAAGETQSATRFLLAGERQILLRTAPDHWICKDRPFEKVFRVENLKGKAVEAEVTCQLYTTDSNDRPLLGQPIDSRTFAANRVAVFDWSKIPSGSYWVKMQAKDAEGHTDSCGMRIALFASTDRRLPKKTTAWRYDLNRVFDADHPAEVCFGTTEKDLYVLMRVACGNQILKDSALVLSDTIVRFRWPYRESYGGGLLVKFCTVRDGQVHEFTSQLSKRLPDKRLKIKREVFRDKLRPGAQEEWTFSVRTPQGQPAEAEMLALMYDASLDKLWNHSQRFLLSYSRPLPGFSWYNPGFTRENRFDSGFNRTYRKAFSLGYDSFEFINTTIGDLLQKARESRKKQADTTTLWTGKEVALSSYEKAEYVDWSRACLAFHREGTEKATWNSRVFDVPDFPASRRLHLPETVFFYPQLRTNEQGEVAFSFRVPEGLARWNFRGYAHTKDMLQGTLEFTATTAKEFVLESDLPRSVQAGSRASLAASLSNLTGQAQEGTVTLTLFDPATEKVWGTQEQFFSVAAGQDASLSFHFTVPDECKELACRLVADSGTFGDGEQRLLPVAIKAE